MSSQQSVSIKRAVGLVLVCLLVMSALQVELAEAKEKSDLIFVKGKFIKKDKKGTIVVEEKSHCGCGYHRR